jgi:hypothetical protein
MNECGSGNGYDNGNNNLSNCFISIKVRRNQLYWVGLGWVGCIALSTINYLVD